MDTFELRIPDLLGEVAGFRAFRIDWCGRVPRLFSVAAPGSVDTLWPTNRWFVAQCPRGHPTEAIPADGCGCGLYAAKSVEQLRSLWYGAYGSGDAEKVVGQVGFAGTVIEGTKGWRAQRGRIVHLWVPLQKWEWVEPLNRAYGVPVGVTDWRPFERP